MGPDGSQNFDVYLRTAVSVEPGGWAHFDHVKMPDYRWGIFLAERDPNRKIGFGDSVRIATGEFSLRGSSSSLAMRGTPFRPTDLTR